MTILPGMHVVILTRDAKKDNTQGGQTIYLLSRGASKALHSGGQKPSYLEH